MKLALITVVVALTQANPSSEPQWYVMEPGMEVACNGPGRCVIFTAAGFNQMLEEHARDQQAVGAARCKREAI